MRFCAFLFLLAAGPAFSQTSPLGNPGPWTGNAQWIQSGSARFEWGFPVFPSTGAGGFGSFQSTSVSTTVTGPGSLDFTWSCTQTPGLPVTSLGSIRVGSLTLPASTSSGGAPLEVPGSIPLVAGSQTVTFTLEGGWSPEIYSPNGHVLSATLKNVRVVNPAAEIADGLDTSLPVQNVTGWQRQSATGWEGGDHITLGTGTGAFSAQVTGPGVLAFRANYSGPYYNNIGEPVSSLSLAGVPGADFLHLNFTLGSTAANGTRSYAIPAGTHTLTWNATSGAGGGAQTVWMMDHLRVHGSADYAEALENSMNWSWSGTSGTMPLPAKTGYDGTDSVTFPALDVHGFDTTSALSTTVSGPGILTFWWRANNSQPMQLLRDGTVQTSTTGNAWSKHVLRLNAGPQTLQWRSANDGLWSWSAGGALDQVRQGTPFENWLAAQLTDTELQQSDALNPSADADGDGRGALMEYALQTSPLAAGGDRAPVLSRDPGNPALLRFTWLQSEAVSGISFTAQASTNLVNWTPLTSSQTGVSGTDKVMQATLDTSTDGRRWVRLLVQ